MVMTAHAVWWSLMLALLEVFLRSSEQDEPTSPSGADKRTGMAILNLGATVAIAKPSSLNNDSRPLIFPVKDTAQGGVLQWCRTHEDGTDSGTPGNPQTD